MSIKNREQEQQENDLLKRLKRLWVAVVKRAIGDTFSHNPRIRDDAIWYIYNDSSGFKAACDALDLDLSAVRAGLKAITEEEWNKNKRLYFRINPIEKPKRRKKSDG